MVAKDTHTTVTAFLSETHLKGALSSPCLVGALHRLAGNFSSPLLSVLSLQPTKVLGIYTFTKRVALEEMENKPRKQQGYSTVSHFNIVHYDCHLAAVR